MKQGYIRVLKNCYGDKIVIQGEKEGYRVHIHHGSSMMGTYCETMNDVISEIRKIMYWRDATEEEERNA